METSSVSVPQYHFQKGAKELILDRNNNARDKGKNSRGSKNYEKYSLRPRSIQNRIETEKRRKEDPKKKPKPKQKPPPLSKYRRKTANARERTRMKEINQAFDALQRAVPQYPILPVNSSGKTCEKLTKITTLRLAMNYIDALKTLLNPSVETDEFSSGSSEFSPASSYIMSPLSSPPDCIQTVMRSVVSPSSFASSPSSSSSSVASPCSSSSVVSNSCSSVSTEPQTNHHLFNSHLLSSCNKDMILPVRTSVAAFMAECLQPALLSTSTTTAISNCISHSNNDPANNHRNGSLSSLNESDFSEYASDLLSDEGSTLGDPMFEDLISVGVVATDFPDLLLESDGDSLHFSSDLSDN